MNNSPKKSIPLRVRKHAPNGAPSEAYHAHYHLGTLEASSTSDLGCAYANSQLTAAIRADHLGEFLGSQTPRFPLRPVWFQDFNPDTIHVTCDFLAECGYNALVTESVPTEKLSLRLIQKVTDLSEVSRHADFVLIELIPSSDELLELEVAEKRIADWEKQLGKTHKLIVYLSCTSVEAAQRQAEWLPELCDRCAETTILAFPAIAGAATDIEASLHPLWSRLRTIHLSSAVGFMPVVNAGMLQLGEGLWPILNAARLEEILAYMSYHTFAGLLCLAGAVPPCSGLAACNLWIAGQVQWVGRTANPLIDTWFRAYRPDLDPNLFQKTSKDAEQIMRKLAVLRNGNVPNEEARVLSDIVVSQLTHFSRQFASHSDYIRYFCRDAWCFLVDALNILRLPLTPVLLHADLSGGFWTEAGSGHKITVRSTPQPRLGDPSMIRLFHENR